MYGLIASLRRIWRPVSISCGEDRQALLKRLPKNACCAEIGVWKGQFSTRILKITRPTLLHLVDPWNFQPQFFRRHYGGRTAHNQEDMDSIYNQVVAKFGHMSNVQIHRSTSEAFFSNLMEKLDWVYIDGDHSEDAVFEDLSLTWQCVKNRGLITGDDYYWSECTEVLPVRMAVDRFCQQQRCSKELMGGQYVIRRP
jgi:Methyltransferase domain